MILKAIRITAIPTLDSIARENFNYVNRTIKLVFCFYRKLNLLNLVPRCSMNVIALSERIGNCVEVK